MPGDKDKKESSSKDENAEAVPSYLGGGVNSQFAQAMPGQLQAIASQLSAGYGAPVAQNMSFLESLYSPMSVPMQPAKAPQASKKNSHEELLRSIFTRELSRGNR